MQIHEAAIIATMTDRVTFMPAPGSSFLVSFQAEE
jgi:hypothetical protein